MTAATTSELLRGAVERRSAVLAFNVITLEHAEAVVDGLQRTGSSGIVQLSERALAYRGTSMVPMIVACSRLIEEAGIPVALHLDHVQDPALADRLIDSAPQWGISSIMVDFSTRERAENMELTRASTVRAHARGLLVEAELGKIGGKDGAHAFGARTDPEDARAFVAETGVDALAVAIGSSHAMSTRDARLDLALLGELELAVPVPLVLHGSSGVPDEQIVAAVAGGIRKVNIGTALNASFTAAVRAVLTEAPALTDPREYLRAGRSAASDTVAAFCALLAAHTLDEGAP